MIHVVSVMIVMAAMGGETLQELDEQFREEFLEVVPEDYAEASTGYLFEEAAIIADRIYSPFSQLLGEIAQGKIASMPVADSDILEGFTLRDSVDFENLRLLDMLAVQGNSELDGFLYLLRFWDPATAAGYSKSFVIAWLISTAELGGRTLSERIVPDRYYFLEGEILNPTLAVVSLRDVFTVELVLDESGCYVPVLFKWYVQNVAE